MTPQPPEPNLPAIHVVPATDPRGERIRWTVSSKGRDDAYVMVMCIDCADCPPEEPLGRVLAKMEVPREIVPMLAMAMLYDDFKVDA